MGNNQSQYKNHIKLKTKTKQQFKIIFNQKGQSLFKIIIKNLIANFNNLLQLQTFGCFQIECQRYLNIKFELIQSQNWKIILQSVMCIPIRSLPYGEAIKSVRYQIKQFPIFIEQKINYSGFQKAIIYFQNQFSQKKQINKNINYRAALHFASNNKDILLRIRQGFEIHTQLPELLMLIYNLHDYVKIFYKYLEIRFSRCKNNIQLNQLINLTIDLTPKLNNKMRNYQFIYLDNMYMNYHLHLKLSNSKMRLKHFIKQANKCLNFEDLNSYNNNFGNEVQSFRNHLSLQQSIQQKLDLYFNIFRKYNNRKLRNIRNFINIYKLQFSNFNCIIQ